MQIEGKDIFEVTQIAYGGKGIVRRDGQIIFVPGVLLGERIRLGQEHTVRGVVEAEVAEILLAHPQRQLPPCPHYRDCGGCDFQYASIEAQRQHKTLALEECWRRTARLNIPPLEILVAEPWEYRGRMQLHCDSQGRWGLKERSGARVVPIPGCRVASRSLQPLLAMDAPDLSRERRVVVGGADDQVWIEGRDNLAALRFRQGEIRFPVEGFFQSNPAMLQVLVDWIDAALPPDCRGSILDLYGGVGTFAVLLGNRFDQGWVVETHGAAADQARHNLPEGKFRVHCGTVADWTRRYGKGLRPDLIVVDPPRNGLEKPVVDFLVQTRPRHLVYVSCNPVTQARDAALLAAAGCRFTRLALADFYPQTWHMESSLLGEFV